MTIKRLPPELLDLIYKFKGGSLEPYSNCKPFIDDLKRGWIRYAVTTYTNLINDIVRRILDEEEFLNEEMVKRRRYIVIFEYRHRNTCTTFDIVVETNIIVFYKDITFPKSFIQSRCFQSAIRYLIICRLLNQIKKRREMRRSYR